MAELTINRVLDADLATVFDFITKSEHLLEWWGPEGISLPDRELDFTKTGPWHSVMRRPDGSEMKVSGQVTHVKAPSSVGFTWARHDETGKRGDESHVTISLRAAAGGGTEFSLHHQELVSEEAAAAHNAGWTSSVRKLEKMAAQEEQESV